MPPLSDGIAALVQLFGDARRRGAPMTLTVEQVENVAIAMQWVGRDLDELRARLRALEIEVACLEAVGRALELPLDDTPAAKEHAKEALLDAMAAGKVVMFDMIRRPAFCDGGAHVSS